ncbi:hypothetical protein [Jannaschia sp. M317]|uniref:hypothetical protein n=1 Tax=Jannaschia sp. M317 TaxID=2867011 RepID=UPI0021A3CDA5|nr:hypothetical protein [Jannaschia sp. M317]UWQ17078.1 hypothetical protein K3551_14455 [Jannaschia sp. M317]
MAKAQPDPSQPLANPRWENFALHSSKGLTLADAYLKSTPPGKTVPTSKEGAKISGHKLSKKRAVAARVEWLRQTERERQNRIAGQLADDADSYSRADVLKLFGEVSDTLHAAYVIGQNSAISPLRLEQLRRVWSDHTGRLAKYEEDHEIKPDAPDGLAERLNATVGKICTCRT